MFDEFHKKTNGKQKPGLLSGVLSASPRRDILLFGGVPDPVRRAWTRPCGGYKTKEQKEQDIARCEEYLSEHEPPHVGPFGWVHPAARRRPRPGGQQGQRDAAPVGVNPGAPAPIPPPAPIAEEASVGNDNSDDETELGGSQRAPITASDAGTELREPRRRPAADGDAGSVVGRPRRGPGAVSDAGSEVGGPRRPRGPASHTGSEPRGPQRPDGWAGNRPGHQPEARSEDDGDEVVPFDENTTVDGQVGHARYYYAPHLSLYAEPQRRITDPNESRWLAGPNPHFLAARRRLTERNASARPTARFDYIYPCGVSEGQRSSIESPRLRRGAGSPGPSSRSRLHLRGGADREEDLHSEGLRPEDAPSEVQPFDDRTTVAGDERGDELEPLPQPRRRPVRGSARSGSHREQRTVIAEDEREDEPEPPQRTQGTSSRGSARSSSHRGPPTEILDDDVEDEPEFAPPPGARQAGGRGFPPRGPSGRTAQPLPRRGQVAAAAGLQSKADRKAAVDDVRRRLYRVDHAQSGDPVRPGHYKWWIEETIHNEWPESDQRKCIVEGEGQRLVHKFDMITSFREMQQYNAESLVHQRDGGPKPTDPMDARPWDLATSKLLCWVDCCCL